MKELLIQRRLCPIFLSILKQALIFEIWGYEKIVADWKTLFFGPILVIRANNKIYSLVFHEICPFFTLESFFNNFHVESLER